MNIQEDLRRYKNVLQKQKTRKLVLDRAMELIEDLLTTKEVKNCSIPNIGFSLPDEYEINSMQLKMECFTPSEEEYTTAGFKSGVRWLKNNIERQLQGQ